MPALRAMPAKLPPHGGPGEVEEIEHNPQAEAHALGLYDAIRRHDRNAVDSLSALAKDRALEEAEAKWQTDEDVYHLRRYILYGNNVAQREENGIAETVILGRDAPGRVDNDQISDEAPEPNNWTALHVAAQCGNADATSTFVGQEAVVNPRGNGALTPLHEAARSGAAQVVGPLAQFGADPDARGTSGLTPLHIACRYGHTAVVAALCDAGARAWDCLGDRDGAHELSKDVYGETVLDMCKRYKRRLCAVELRGHRSRMLCEAARNETVKVKEEKGVDALHSSAALQRAEEHYDKATAFRLERLKRFEAVYSYKSSVASALPPAQEVGEESEEDPVQDGKALVRLYIRAAYRFRRALRPPHPAVSTDSIGS